MNKQPFYEPITQKYEIFDSDEASEPICKASVNEGLIDSLMIRSDVQEAYQGQIFNRLLRCIVEDADHYNSNLSIKVAAPDSMRLKRFLERFGFLETTYGIYKRNAGSSIPPSVIY